MSRFIKISSFFYVFMSYFSMVSTGSISLNKREMHHTPARATNV